MISYRLASREDNQQLIELTAATGMEGETALRIDRHPDFFTLLDRRGESRVFVALDGSQIIGSLCVSLQKVWVGGQIETLHYVGDLKVIASHRNQGIGLQLCNELANEIVPQGADLAFLNVARGNNKPFTFFKNRPHIPDFDPIGIFKIQQFIGRRKPVSDRHYEVRETPVSEELTCFLNRFYNKYELGPVITKEQLEGSQILTIRDNNKIIAAMCLSDTMHMKQNVVLKLSMKLKWTLNILNSLSGISGFSKMPVLHEPVRLLYIKYLAVDQYDRKLVKLLINQARHLVYRKSYSFASIGLHEKDPLLECFSGMFKLSFYSVGMLLSIKNNRSLIEKVIHGIPFEDYSLV